AGLVALWRSGLPAVAIAVVLLAVELLAAGIAGRYPFLDPRTSTFLTTLLTVCGALGVAAAVAWSARRPATLALGVALARGGGGVGAARPGRAPWRHAPAAAQPPPPAGGVRPRPPPAGRHDRGRLGGQLQLRLLLAGAAHLRPH